MTNISTPPLPDNALLRRYDNGAGHYTDCYSVTVSDKIELPNFVEAFYTAPLFRSERVVLKFAARRPSTDEDAANVASGQTSQFAVWDVEDRSENQLLMCDMTSKTRSWFMTREVAGGTQLFFGSAVIADKDTGKQGFLFHALAPVHNIYARALLKGAVNRLNQGPAQTALR